MTPVKSVCDLRKSLRKPLRKWRVGKKQKILYFLCKRARYACNYTVMATRLQGTLFLCSLMLFQNTQHMSLTAVLVLSTCGTMFLNDSMILDDLFSWQQEKTPVTMTTTDKTTPRYKLSSGGSSQLAAQKKDKNIIRLL